jgi:hypothetical protein
MEPGGFFLIPCDRNSFPKNHRKIEQNNHDPSATCHCCQRHRCPRLFLRLLHKRCGSSQTSAHAAIQGNPDRAGSGGLFEVRQILFPFRKAGYGSQEKSASCLFIYQWVHVHVFPLTGRFPASSEFGSLVTSVPHKFVPRFLETEGFQHIISCEAKTQGIY